MDLVRDLLFGALAVRLEHLRPEQLAEAWAERLRRPGVGLAESLRRRGWMDEEGCNEVDRAVERRLRWHGGDPAAALMALDDNRARRRLAELAPDALAETAAETPGRSTAPRPLVEVPDPEPPGGPPAPATDCPRCAASAARYRLVRLHARGGIGRVWLARDGRLGREVARKELRPEKADSPSARRRLAEEARITGQLQHPAIVPVYELDVDPDTGAPFYTMRLVKGRTLGEAARAYHQARRDRKAGAVELVELLEAFVAACNAVAYAHSRGVIHRDLKGPNVLLGKFGEVVVLDWGLARLVDRGAVDGGSAPVILDGVRDPTLDGRAIGTPAYMPPEQAAGRDELVDRRSDVFGLGAILYEILTGRPPFDGGDADDQLRRARDARPPSPRQLCRWVPVELESICCKALSREPHGRYPTATALANDVRRFLADEPVHAAPASWRGSIRRFVRRRRVGLMLCVLVAVVIAELLRLVLAR